MDVERLLLTRIVTDKDLHHVLERGVKADWFLDKKNEQIFEALLRHKSRYGEVPSLEALRLDFPDFKPLAVEDSMEFLTDEIRRLHTLALLEQGLNEAVTAYDTGDPERVMNRLHVALRQIAVDVPHSRDTNLTETGDERLARYKALRDLPDGLRGIPTGFPSIDQATQGLQKQQLITFVGPPKAGKSTLLLLAALSAHMNVERPLFLSFEMSNEEQEERFDSFRAHISNRRLRGGELSKAEMDRLARSMRQLEAMPDFILSSDSMSATTLSGVQAKIEQYEPTVVFVDGVYMMDDEVGEPKGSPQALTNITRGFKRMAQNTDLPIAISTQALESKMEKKRILSLSSIGYSSSFGQDSDVVFGVERTEEEDIQKLKILAARSARNMEAYIRWDWEHGIFQEIEDYGEPEADF